MPEPQPPQVPEHLKGKFCPYLSAAVIEPKVPHGIINGQVQTVRIMTLCQGPACAIYDGCQGYASPGVRAEVSDRRLQTLAQALADIPFIPSAAKAALRGLADEIQQEWADPEPPPPASTPILPS